MPGRGLSRIVCVFLAGILVITSFLGKSSASAAFPPVPSSFGVEVQPPTLTNSSMLDLIDQAGIYWARTVVLDWSLIEPVKTNPPTYHWDSVVDAALQQANANGLKVIAQVKFTPAWAQKVRGSICGPILSSEFSRFAQFMQAAVLRYRGNPYNVKYWELGNEPDVDPSLVPDDSVFGCWGDQNDDYYGGGYYAEMLKVVYPVIKSTDLQAQVLNGGLLLDCDPEHPPAGKDCKPAKFLEGILRRNGANDGGNYFDIVSFHGYPPYMDTADVKPLAWDEHNPSWLYQTGDDGVGGVVMGKIHFIRKILSEYGVSKPLMQTEGSLVCTEGNPKCNPPGSEFYESQADYVVWLYVRNLAAGIQSTIWYSFEDPAWRYVGMLDKKGQAKPVYNAFKFLTQELKSANYGGTVTQYPGLRGYEFYKPGRRVWVLWAPDEEPHSITLDPNTLIVYDKYGIDITPADKKNLTVNNPVYVELSPDLVKPTVSWVLPVTDGKSYQINSSFVHLEVLANDNIGISKVRFFHYEPPPKGTWSDIGYDYTYPYTWELDIRILNCNYNEVAVMAYDRSGNASYQKSIFLFRPCLFFFPVIHR
jgi:hypothetical protein